MVEFPNDGRGRVSEGRGVVKKEDVVEVAVAIGQSPWEILPDGARRGLCLLNESASLSSPDAFTPLGIGPHCRKLQVNDDWCTLDKSCEVA